MRVWPYVAFTGSVLFVWSLTEAEVSLLLTDRYTDIALLVAIWGVTWFLSYRMAVPYTAHAYSRKRLYFASTILSVSAASLVMLFDSIFHAMIAYLLSTSSLALSISTSMASILRGDPSGDIASLIAKLRVYPGIAHAMLAVLYTLFDVHILAIILIIIILMMLIIVQERAPIIPAITLEVVDKFTEALIHPNKEGNRVSIPIIALLISMLSIAKLVYMPSAVSANIYMGIALYAGALALGAILGTVIKSGTTLFITLLISSILTLIVDPWLFKFTIIAIMLAFTDINAFLTTAIMVPSKIPVLSWRIALSLLVFSVLIAFISELYGRIELILGFLILIVSISGLLMLRKRSLSWE